MRVENSMHIGLMLLTNIIPFKVKMVFASLGLHYKAAEELCSLG